ncbi:unnamed protein product [Caenorhabditis angaria]|uniref:Nondiscriminating glutamyl-tRNA synthetase EARS2, mitochondrial n=1 Tax=Caenorhabditis angaria TaxID=860376 RepID=A0A9P1IN57_9PELO|nr:unnamed protein product [Caenorhabditis angaria]
MRVSRALLNEVRVRFAPSPTGQLHIGGLRTAFFNYLFAKKYGGKFILRIEDTDQTRLVKGAQGQISNILKHYDLEPDEGPVVQSERLNKYRDAAEELIENGHAYRCFCSSERLDLLRKTAARNGEIPKYDRKCANIDKNEALKMSENGEKCVIRLKLDKQNVSFKDGVFGDINQVIDESDAILLKSDGFPTYHLANVVDDKDMKISHVIRGMEWLSSTGKHHILYKSFNWTPPKYLHLSLIMRTATKKLSKRDSDAYVDYYNEKLGVLPLAILNMMIRNGSGIRNFDPNHFYSISEMVENFDPELLGRRNLLLDSDILHKYSRMAFQNSSFPEIYRKICEKFGTHDEEKVRKVVEFLRAKEENFGNLSELAEDGPFGWMLFENNGENVEDTEILKKIDSWKVEKIREVAKSHGIPEKKLLEKCRIALIGRKKGPPVSEIVDFLGEDECYRRISERL